MTTETISFNAHNLRVFYVDAHKLCVYNKSMERRSIGGEATDGEGSN